MAKKSSHLSAPKWIKWLREWQASRDEVEDAGELSAALNDGNTFKVFLRSHTVAPYYAVRGAIALWSGQQDGWQDLFAYWVMEATRVALHVNLLDSAIAKRGKYVDGKMGISQLHWIEMNSAALMLATATSFGKESYSNWLGNRLEQSIRSSDQLVGFPWNQTDFERNMVKLDSLQRGRPIDELNLLIGGGVFQRLFDNWEDDAALQRIVTDLCDYHLENCRSDDDVYTTLPFPFFPAEILAILSIRRKLGFATPTPAHPLLETSFARIPNPLPTLPESHLATRVARYSANEYSSIESVL